MAETKQEVKHERDVAMRLYSYGTPLRTQKMLAAEKILREEYGHIESSHALLVEVVSKYLAGRHGSDDLRAEAEAALQAAKQGR